MGTAAFAVPTLGALLDAGHRVAQVYTQPPRPAGRGQKSRPSPVHALASDRGLKVRTPERLDTAAAEAFAEVRPDAAVVVAYGLIVPRAILDMPRFGCINLHASLLPRWRGAAPIQRAILAGDTRTGVTAMQMDEGLDTGPILAVREVAIPPAANAGLMHDTLAAKAAALATAVLAQLAEKSLAARPQPSEGVTHAAKIDPGEVRIDFSLDAQAIDRQVRAFSPNPGAWTVLGGKRLKVLGTDPPQAAPGEPGGNAPIAPGTAIDDGLLVACGEGAIRLTRVQRGGRSAMDAPAFLRGVVVPAGTVLGR
jgi:methionyl-tRNA formyltransferase